MSMTHEEMVEKVQEHCNGKSCGENCLIREVCNSIDGKFDDYYGKCVEALKLLGYDIPLTRAEKHGLICDEIKELFKRKNTDYGDSFHQTFLEEGFATSRIRLNDKLERFKRLTKSGEQNVKDENIRDTLIDLANYSIMTILELEDSDNENH